jgi:hypothetical protein
MGTNAETPVLSVGTLKRIWRASPDKMDPPATLAAFRSLMHERVGTLCIR